MKENSEEKKSILFYIGIGLIGLLIVLTVGVYLYCNIKGKIDDENGYNSINAIIAGFALVVNIITIAFVYATYQKQKQQIDDNKKDGEFNRVLDIVYKQLEHSKEKYKDTNYGASLETCFTKIFNVELKDFYKELLAEGSPNELDFCRLFSFFSNELKTYYVVINLNNKLTDVDRDFFTSLFADNIDNRLMSRIKEFRRMYFEFQKNELYEKFKLVSPRIQQVEYELNLILKYLRINTLKDSKFDN